MENKELICPKCSSKNIHRGVSFAAKMTNVVQDPHVVPHECKDCRHKWIDESI